MWRWGAICLACGCGRIGFDVSALDGALRDGSAADGGGDATALGPFSVPVNATELDMSGTNSEDPTLTDDRSGSAARVRAARDRRMST